MSAPERTCVGCRSRASAVALLRVVLVEGRLRADPGRRMPGRGAWVHPQDPCVAAATRRRAWSRALRATGPVDATDLAQSMAGIVSPASGTSAGRQSTVNVGSPHEDVHPMNARA